MVRSVGLPGGASIQTQTAWSRQRTLWGAILYLETQDQSRDPERNPSISDSEEL